MTYRKLGRQPTPQTTVRGLRKIATLLGYRLEERRGGWYYLETGEASFQMNSLEDITDRLIMAAAREYRPLSRRPSTSGESGGVSELVAREG